MIWTSLQKCLYNAKSLCKKDKITELIFVREKKTKWSITIKKRGGGRRNKGGTGKHKVGGAQWAKIMVHSTLIK